MGFKVKKPKPPSVKKAVQAVKKAVPRPAAKAATAVRKVAATAKKAAPKVARAAQRVAKSVKPSVKKATKAIKTQAKKGQSVVKKISNAAKKAGRGVSKSISKTSQKTKTAAKAIKTKGKQLKSTVKKAAGKAKKAFAKSGKKASKAAKSAKKKLGKTLQKAKKAKVIFPKNVKGPKATCPLLTGKGAKLASVKLKAPKLKIPKPNANVVGGIIGGVAGGTIGLIVGGIVAGPVGAVGAVVGARVGARIGRQEFNKPKVVNKRTPDYSSTLRAGKPQPGNKTQRHTASTSAGVYPGKQDYNNCGVQSCAQIIAQATGVLPDEKVLLKFAIENGWAEKNGSMRSGRSIRTASLAEEDGGTRPWTRKEILAAYGVSSKTYQFEYDNRTTLEKGWDDAIKNPIVDAYIKSTGEQPDPKPDVTRGTHTYRDTLGHAIWEGKGIIASIHTDGASWWKNADGTSRGSGFHAFCVVDGDFDSSGNLTHVYLTDTGVNEPKMSVPPPAAGRFRPGPLKVPIADYMKAVQSRADKGMPMELVITDNKIWP
jgi:hypothetical protein